VPDDRWSIVEIRTGMLVGVDEELLTPEDARVFAGELLDAAVRAEARRKITAEEKVVADDLARATREEIARG